MRFRKHIHSFEEGLEYYKKRAVQLLRFNYFLIEVVELDYGVYARFIDENSISYYSLFIYEDKYGQGYFKKFMSAMYNPVIITSDDCNLENFLKYNNYPYKIVNIYNSYYHIISNFYLDRKAKRSGVDYMNHIDEGLAILRWLKLDLFSTCAAYALHPIVQMDNDLEEFLNRGVEYEYLKYEDNDILILMMEYRSVANEYLSHRTINSINEIRLSPLYKVNDMLIADKIQNRKDFELYHNGLNGKEKHPRAAILDKYFKDWLERLNISECDYQLIKNRLTVNPKIIKLN